MLFEVHYFSIQESKKAVYKVRGSEFISFATEVKSDVEVKDKLKRVKEKYPDASHHCYAFVLHADKSHQYSSDDGEPNGTGGRPILKQINALNLTNVLVISVRYFGGKKLGIPGLIDAYGTSAKEVLAKCKIVQQTLKAYYTVIAPFEVQHVVYNIAQSTDAEIIKTQQSEEGVQMELSINRNDGKNLENALNQQPKIDWKALGIK